jgi:hypothetical protein
MCIVAGRSSTEKNEKMNKNVINNEEARRSTPYCSLIKHNRISKFKVHEIADICSTFHVYCLPTHTMDGQSDSGIAILQ